jgi:hypothetical protein
LLDFAFVATSKRERQKANRQIKLEEQTVEQKKSKLKRQVIIWGVALLILLLGIYLYSVSGSDDGDKTSTNGTDTTIAGAEAAQATSTAPAASQTPAVSYPDRGENY